MDKELARETLRDALKMGDASYKSAIVSKDAPTLGILYAILQVLVEMSYILMSMVEDEE